MFLFFLFCINVIVSAYGNAQTAPKAPYSLADILQNIAQKRSKFSPFKKITIEEAYCALGEHFFTVTKKNISSEFDEVSCFKFHKQFFRGDKIIATIGRHAGKIYDQHQEKKGREILLTWKRLAEKQMSAPYPYTRKGKKKISQVYDFGEDAGGFFHICVLKAFVQEANAQERSRSSSIKKDIPVQEAISPFKMGESSPAPNSLLGRMLAKEEKGKVQK